jgi:hypothetical protein
MPAADAGPRHHVLADVWREAGEDAPLGDTVVGRAGLCSADGGSTTAASIRGSFTRLSRAGFGSIPAKSRTSRRVARQQLRRLLLGLLCLPLRASRLRGTHRRDSIFVDLNDVASRVWAPREALETSRSPENDRVGVAAGLDDVALFDLLVEERVEAVPTSPERVDLSHGREYRRRGCSRYARGMRPTPASSRPHSSSFVYLPKPR